MFRGLLKSDDGGTTVPPSSTVDKKRGHGRRWAECRLPQQVLPLVVVSDASPSPGNRHRRSAWMCSATSKERCVPLT